MDKVTQIELLGKIFKTRARFEVEVNVWNPGIPELKRLLNMGHVRIRRNDERENTTIFTIFFGHILPSFAAVEVTFFCNEEEAKFMREYYKEKGGE